jgi:hypothetical protein
VHPCVHHTASRCYSEMPGAATFIRRRGLLSSQFWRVQVQGLEAPLIRPLVRVVGVSVSPKRASCHDDKWSREGGEDRLQFL